VKGSIRTTRAWRRLAGVAAVAAVAMLSVTAVASAGTTATVGQTGGEMLCGNYWFLQADYAVPAGSWQLTSWSTQAGSPGGSMGLMVFRVAGSGTWTVVGASPVETLVDGTLNVFDLATPIAVQGGDVIGMEVHQALCGGGGSGSIFGGFGGTPPAVGQTVSPPLLSGGFAANISVTLTRVGSAGPATKDDCKNGGWQSFGQFKNQGDCVSFVATGGKKGPGK
jgi:hypothetical protein